MESSEDKLGHIVRCCAEKEFLRLFDLPRPYLDPLGRLAWDGSDEIVSKKYRKLAIYCHADRAGDGVDANKAFEALQNARDYMLDAEKREVMFRNILDDDAAARAFGRRGVAAENVEDQLDEFKEFKKLTTSMRAQEQKDMQAGVRAAQKELREQAIKRQRLKEERESEDEKQAKLDSLKKSRVSVDHRDDDADSRKPAIKKKKFKSGLF